MSVCAGDKFVECEGLSDVVVVGWHMFFSRLHHMIINFGSLKSMV